MIKECIHHKWHPAATYDGHRLAVCLNCLSVDTFDGMSSKDPDLDIIKCYATKQHKNTPLMLLDSEEEMLVCLHCKWLDVV